MHGTTAIEWVKVRTSERVAQSSEVPSCRGRYMIAELLNLTKEVCVDCDEG